MGGITDLIIAVLAVAVVVLTYLLIRKRAQPGQPAAPEPLPPAAAPIEPAQPEPGGPEPAVTPIAAMPGALPPLPPTQQFFELTTVDNKLIRLAITKPLTSVGRAPDNDIIVNEMFPGYESVADHHAQVELRGELAIVYAQSPAELFVNDRRTGKNLLRNGWRVGFGDVEMVFRTAGLGTAPLNISETSHPLPGSEPAAPRRGPDVFAALPEGALIANQYAVIEIRNELPHINVYVVEALDPVRRCPQCGYAENPIEREACVNCAAPLKDMAPYYPHYLVKETDDKSSLAVEFQLAGLTHPAALLPRGTLVETPYGNVERHYLLGPDAPRWLAATSRVPQKVTDVLAWGEQLAEALAYLHHNNVTLGPIDTWRVALDGPQARWVDFASCEYVTDPERVDRFAADVAGLASVLYYMLTGQREYTQQQASSLPPVVDNLFVQTLHLKSMISAEQFAQAIRAASVEIRKQTSMRVCVGCASDVGRVRSLNEDSVLALDLVRIQRSISNPLGLYAVADGMGGHAAGDIASALTVDTLARKAVSELWMDYLLESDAAFDFGAWLKLAVQEANQVVFGRRRASTSDMGTTLVTAVVCGSTSTATIANSGDSRAYLINQDQIRQLTTDHSLVQRLIQMGQLTPQEARTHPQRNVIYKNLGDKPRIEPDVIEVKLNTGDRLLLCSDGLSGMITDEAIHQIVTSAASVQAACNQLIEAANAAGGEDNISVILVQIEALG